MKVKGEIIQVSRNTIDSLNLDNNDVYVEQKQFQFTEMKTYLSGRN